MKKNLVLLIFFGMLSGAASAQTLVPADVVRSYVDGQRAVQKNRSVQPLEVVSTGKAVGNGSKTVRQGTKDEQILRRLRSARAGKQAAAAPWQRVYESNNKALPDTVRHDTWHAGAQPVRSRAVKHLQKAVELPLKEYFSQDSSKYSGFTNASMKLIKEGEAYKMVNVFGIPDTVTVNVDAAAGTVSISPQKIAYSSTYESDVYIYPVDLATNKYSTTDPITGVVDAEGVIRLNSWGVFVAEGEHKGGIFDAFSYSRWMPANATLTSTDQEGNDSTIASRVEQTFDNELVIYNFAGNGTAVTATITPSQTVKVSPQYIHSNAMYGDFYCFPVDLDKKQVDSKSPIVGTGTDSTLTFGSWIVGARAIPNVMSMIFAKTEIKTSLFISYPESLDVKFEGNGTKADPYLIKTSTDLDMLSQSVGAGESYKGKYFTLANDIDMSADRTSAFVPVGSPDAPFDGVFDGNGKVISNLVLNHKGNYYGGLFGYAGDNSIIENFNLKNGKLTGSGTYYGLVAGYTKGKIDHCAVDGTIVSTGVIAGGVVGTSEKSVRNSTFSGKLSGYGSLGGIAGNSYGEIASCSVDAYIDITGYLTSLDTDGGGIVGELFSVDESTPSATDCYFSGTLVDTRGLAYTGGIGGLVAYAKIERCFNTAVIQSSNNSTTGGDTGSGGLVGVTTYSEFTNCYNAGSIVRSGENASEGAGGLAGNLLVSYTVSSPPSIDGLSKFTNCYNSGIVKSSSSATYKGLYGRTFVLEGFENPAPGMFDNCYFDAQVTGLKDEKFGRPTSFFTSGTLPEGFESALWTASKDAYPVLKSVSDNDAARLSSASFVLADGESATKVKSAFTTSAPAGITWKLYDGKTFVSETASLKMEGSKVSIKDQYDNAILTALSPDGDLRMYTLAVVPKVFEGEGTAQSPYLIKTKDDFVKLDKAVRVYNQPHEGDFFTMTNDIDFAYADDFSGVGVGGATPFGGTFDGQNHYIHKLKIHSAAYNASGEGMANGSYFAAGLFNTCSAGSTLKNIRIAADCDFDFWGESGPVAGYTEGTITGCRNYANINSVAQYVAGIVGVVAASAKITECYNVGKIVCGRFCAGGIAAYNKGTVELCQNDGEVSAQFYNSFVRAGSQYGAGGIVGENYGKMYSNVNNGTVSSYQMLGGIAATSSSHFNTCEMKGNVNNGLVTDLASNNSRGGVIGYKEGKVIALENNYYDASVNVNGGSMNATVQGITGLSTDEMTGGKVLSGLDEKAFDFVASAYPVLAAFKDEPATKALRAMYIGFKGTDKRTDMSATVALSAAGQLKWTLARNQEFKLDGDTLNVTPPTDMKVAADTLTASWAGEYTKVYYLMSIPQTLFEGKGSAEDPYQLKTPDDVNRLSAFVKASSMEFDGYFFKVMNDIDFQGDSIAPIASGSVNFQGILDGNKKTIFNYDFNNENWRISENSGFFGNIGASGMVHDLTLKGKYHGYGKIGGFVSKLYGTLRNCTNKSDVSAKNAWVGGLVFEAFPGAVIDSCVNEGTVKSVGGGYVAGIVADMDAGSKMLKCVNKGTVTANSSSLAGLVADCEGDISDSHNDVPITSTSGTVAGIAANVSDSVTIDNCYNTADITGSGRVGGVVAYGSSNAKVTIRNSYNTGKVLGSSDTGGFAGILGTGYHIEDCYNKGEVITTKSSTTGGFVAKIDGDEDVPSIIKRCYNAANVTSAGGSTGGFAGSFYSEEVYAEDCYNTGNVSAISSESILGVGGFAGDFSGKATRCWNAGDVKSSGYGVGGLGGYSWGVADSCFNVGNVTAEGIGNNDYGNAGGLWGYGKPTLRNSYNMGSVTGPGMIAGINGNAFWESEITNCYNAGKLVNTGDDKTSQANITIIDEDDLADAVIAKNYYDSDVNGETDYDKLTGATGLAAGGLFAADLGDAFDYHRAAYPTLKALGGNVWAEWAAASVAFTADGDKADRVTDNFYVGVFDGVTWTASDNIRLEADGTAIPIGIGAGWVKATASVDGRVLEKAINLTISKITDGISSVSAGKTCVSRKYYLLNGMEVKSPSKGQVYIVKEIYDDGTQSSKKTVEK